METTIEKLSKDWSGTWSRTNILRKIGTLKRDLTRLYMLKYLPRNGIHLEARCSLGRYAFYLSDLGFGIVGLDADVLKGLMGQEHPVIVDGRNVVEADGFIGEGFVYKGIGEGIRMGMICNKEMSGGRDAW